MLWRLLMFINVFWLENTLHFIFISNKYWLFDDLKETFFSFSSLNYVLILITHFIMLINIFLCFNIVRWMVKTLGYIWTNGGRWTHEGQLACNLTCSKAFTARSVKVWTLGWWLSWRLSLYPSQPVVLASSSPFLQY